MVGGSQASICSLGFYQMNKLCDKDELVDLNHGLLV